MKANVFLIVFSLLLCFISCKTVDNSIFNNNYGTSMTSAYEMPVSTYQIDSICSADKIERNLSTWHKVQFLNEADKTVVTEYLYIKNDNKEQIIYRLVENSGKYKISKRITK